MLSRAAAAVCEKRAWPKPEKRQGTDSAVDVPHGHHLRKIHDAARTRVAIGVALIAIQRETVCACRFPHDQNHERGLTLRRYGGGGANV